jgi:adenine phosphoribosyltransferase
MLVARSKQEGGSRRLGRATRDNSCRVRGFLDPGSTDPAARAGSLVRRARRHVACFGTRLALAALVEALGQPWSDVGATHVVASRREASCSAAPSPCGSTLAFMSCANSAGCCPGPKLSRLTGQQDYGGNRHELRIQATLVPGDVVLMVDDWAETGSQAIAGRELVELAGASFLGVPLAVDQLDPDVRGQLGRVTAVVTADESGQADGTRRSRRCGRSNSSDPNDLIARLDPQSTSERPTACSRLAARTCLSAATRTSLHDVTGKNRSFR